MRGPGLLGGDLLGRKLLVSARGNAEKQTLPKPDACCTVDGREPDAVWHIYIVECADGTFYTGVALDVEARVSRHNEGTGARYTRTRRPVALVYTEEVGDRGAALRREYAVKQMTPMAKRELIATRRLIATGR